MSRGCIPPLCDLLKVAEVKIVTVALEGLENILKVGETKVREMGLQENPHAVHVEQAGGLDLIDNLQQHENAGIYEKSLKILERYFGATEEGAAAGGPAVEASGTFGFANPAAPQAPPQGFNFSGDF